ncbi:MAG: glycosyltransferase family 39 protein, partial [Candidatus Saccharimonadales bacterium]
MTVKEPVTVRQSEPPRPFISEVVKKLFWPIGLLTVLVAACLRLGGLASKPGWEWDEGVYANVSKALAETGLIQVKTEYLSQPEPYLYHPPFHFWLESAWFTLVGSGITQARLLAVVSSLLALLLLLVLLRNIIGAWALGAVALIAIDAWLIFSQRVSWIENTLILVGVIGLCIYQQALLRRSLWLFGIAGVAIGMAVLYKHVGVIFLGAVVINAILTRRHKRGHAIMAAVVAALGVLYVTVMVLQYCATFIAESTVQLMRSTGKQPSTGALNSLTDIITPLLAQYKIFVATLALAGVSAV